MMPFIFLIHDSFLPSSSLFRELFKLPVKFISPFSVIVWSCLYVTYLLQNRTLPLTDRFSGLKISYVFVLLFDLGNFLLLIKFDFWYRRTPKSWRLGRCCHYSTNIIFLHIYNLYLKLLVQYSFDRVYICSGARFLIVHWRLPF